MSENKKIAVFLDRDGVILELPNYNSDGKLSFITSKEEIKFIENSVEAIKKLKDSKIFTIVISNQPQIARGLISKKCAEEINLEINKLLKKEGIEIDAFYFCPHHPTKGKGEYTKDCNCRKPNPGMLLEAAKKYRLDLSKSYMVGDRISDIKAGNLAGCKTIGVKTGYSCEDGFNDAEPDKMSEDLYGAVKIILGDLR